MASSLPAAPPCRLRCPRSRAHSSGDPWGARDFLGPKGSRREAGANSEVCPEPGSLEVTQESPAKTDLERRGKPQAAAGAGRWAHSVPARGESGAARNPTPPRVSSSATSPGKPRSGCRAASLLRRTGTPKVRPTDSTHCFLTNKLCAASRGWSLESEPVERPRLGPQRESAKLGSAAQPLKCRVFFLSL